MRLSVDTWAPSFGSSMVGDEAMTPTSGPVDVGVEVAAADWAPRRAEPGTRPATDVRFVDGVRRIDARVWATGDDGTTTHAAIAVSYAAGTLRCNGRAGLEDAEVRRRLFGPAGMPALDAGTVAYAPYAVAGRDDEALVQSVQQQMGRLEIELATRRDDAQLTVVDGPLSGRQNVRGAVGYVKSHHTSYLPAGLDATVAALAPGERTPLFVTQSSWSRYSWYLRLPHAAGHPWAGIVRLEASGELPLDRVVALADQTAATLPRFASRPHRDPRAPQNLYPIAGLETALKRRLGDAAYLERVLRRAAQG